MGEDGEAAANHLGLTSEARRELEQIVADYPGARTLFRGVVSRRLHDGVSLTVHLKKASELSGRRPVVLVVGIESGWSGARTGGRTARGSRVPGSSPSFLCRGNPDAASPPRPRPLLRCTFLRA